MKIIISIQLTHKGWSNRETWLTSQWLNHNPIDLLIDALNQDGNNAFKAEWLESMFRSRVIDLPIHSSMWTDLLGESLSRVNWLEIIERNLS